MARKIVGSIEAEYRRYKSLAEKTFEQLNPDELCDGSSGIRSSIATVAWHISGNLRSRFTDFLTTDGEKPWRERESEFEARTVSRSELLSKWQEGWDILFEALRDIDDETLNQSVSIRGLPLKVHEALHRSLAHTSYHVGQIVYVGKAIRGDAWTSLSIPPGGSGEYNQAPTLEKPADPGAQPETPHDTSMKGMG